MANIKTYSLKADGESKLYTNFKVKEFKCNDGSDTIKIDLDNVKNLQNIRNYFGKPVTINSAYRTYAYNKAIGGASNSYHTKGQAADIVIAGVDPLKVYLYALSIGVKGAILYPNSKFCHIDTRATKYHAITLDRKTYFTEPKETLKLGSTGASVKWMQYMLTRAGFKVAVDGSYGANTVAVVKKFQIKYSLVPDGSFGPKSLNKLKEVLMK